MLVKSNYDNELNQLMRKYCISASEIAHFKGFEHLCRLPSVSGAGDGNRIHVTSLGTAKGRVYWSFSCTKMNQLSVEGKLNE